MRLAKLNVDAEQELAASLQISQLPTVLLVHKGKLADSFTGAVPDEQLAQVRPNPNPNPSPHPSPHLGPAAAAQPGT